MPLCFQWNILIPTLSAEMHVLPLLHYRMDTSEFCHSCRPKDQEAAQEAGQRARGVVQGAARAAEPAQAARVARHRDGTSRRGPPDDGGRVP